MTAQQHFEAACAALGYDPAILPEVAGLPEKYRNSQTAHYKLQVIAEHWNEGWCPDYDNANEYKYWPYFEKLAGSGFRCGGCVCDGTDASVGSRLVFKTRALARQAGKELEALYNDLLG